MHFAIYGHFRNFLELPLLLSIHTTLSIEKHFIDKKLHFIDLLHFSSGVMTTSPHIQLHYGIIIDIIWRHKSLDA